MTAEDKLWALRQVGQRLERYVEDFLEFAGPMPLLVRAFSWGWRRDDPLQTSSEWFSPDRAY